MDRRFLRPGWIAGHVLVFLAFLTCLRLGWWQWDRSHDADGTAQNLGYALLWPAFGAAFIYMWIRFLHLEVLKDEQDAEDDDRELDAILGDEVSEDHALEGPGSGESQSMELLGAGDPAESANTAPDDGEDAEQSRPARRRPDLQRPSQGVTISIATVGDEDDDDPELTAYNQALAALAEEDRRRAR